jgi:hypothetical protein
MLLIEYKEDEDFLFELDIILAGWTARPISGDERNELADRLHLLLSRAKRIEKTRE